MPSSVHTTVPPLSSQLTALLQDPWEQEVLSQLPCEYEHQAKTLAAFVRVRGLASVGHLLRGLLAYVLSVSSLRQLGIWALLIGLANISHVAWQKRLRNARLFLLWLLREQLAVAATPPMGTEKRIVLIDGTRLKEPGGTGDDWRVHLAYDLVAGRLVDVKVQDRHTGEGFTLFEIRSGDIIVADRGYSRRRQLAYAMDAGAEVVVRIAVSQVPLCDEHGTPLDVGAWLKAASSTQLHCSVTFEYEGRSFAGRLVASALPPQDAERAREKERKSAVKHQRTLKDETLYLCGWRLVFTSLPQQVWPDEQVLTLYRARWQIELVIKRMKQVLKLAQLRGMSALTNEATILALLLAWSLLQSEAQYAREVLTQTAEAWMRATAASNRKAAVAVSVPTVSSWTLTAVSVQTLRHVVQGVWTFARVRECLPSLHRFCCSRRRKRNHQESTIRRSLRAHPALTSFGGSSLFQCSSA